jgi:hypothetical protein
MFTLTVPLTIQKTRIEICQACKFYKQSTRSCGTLIVGRKLTKEELEEIDKDNLVKHYRKKVRLCGCFLPAKTWGIFESCPVGKWGVHALSETEVEQIVSFVDTLPNVGSYNADTVRELNRWHKLLTGSRKNISTCPNCVRETVRTFRREINKYKEQIQKAKEDANTNTTTE